jgi:hypothetical protein
MLIYVNGCSHTAYNNITKLHDLKSWSVDLVEKLGKKCSFFYEVIDNLPKEDILLNDARHGASNDYIFHSSLETLSNLIYQNRKPDYVIIQWTGPNRRLHCDENGDKLFVNLYDNTEYFVKFEPMASEHTVHYMYTLQEYLKKNDINYLFLPYMPLDESISDSSIFKMVDRERIIDFNMGDDIFTKGIINYIKSNNLNRDKQGHPNEEGYSIMSDKIIDKIKRIKIL